MSEREEEEHPKQITCSHCPFSTVHKSSLQLHVQNVHHRVKSFKCDHCDYSSGDKNNLRRHLMQHGGDGAKTLTCAHCPFKTAYKHSLQLHCKNIHYKVKSFRCELCSYASGDKNNLRRHALQHGGEEAKKMACPHCSFKTAYNSSLRGHVRRMHDNAGGL